MGEYYLPEVTNVCSDFPWGNFGGQGYYYNGHGNGYAEFFIGLTGDYKGNYEYNTNLIWN